MLVQRLRFHFANWRSRSPRASMKDRDSIAGLSRSEASSQPIRPPPTIAQRALRTSLRRARTGEPIVEAVQREKLR
jgi:hypothetical protein